MDTRDGPVSGKPFARFDAYYGRRGQIVVADGKCDACRKKARVIIIDSSQNEYNPGAICKSCCLEAFEQEDPSKTLPASYQDTP